MSKRQNYAVILLFLLMIFVPTVISLIKPDSDFSEKENRVLAQMPDLAADDIFSGKFSKDYETYLSDQFFGRDSWISVKTAVERAMGRQEAKDIYFAQDGYLIEKHSNDFSTAVAQNNITYLSSFVNAQAERLGTGHVKTIIAPNAVDILTDKLPPYAENKAEHAYLEQIRAAITPDAWLDAESILMAHKEEDIYYRTDHHWKTLSARYIYEAWAESITLPILPVTQYAVETLTTDFYGTVEAKVNCDVIPDSIEAYMPLNEVSYTMVRNHETDKATNTLYDVSFLEGRDKYAVFFGGNQPIIEISTQSSSDRRLLVLKDSYANCFLPFAVQDFSQVDIIDLRYYNESLKEYIASGGHTDILVLYNASGFAGDSSIIKLGN